MFGAGVKVEVPADCFVMADGMEQKSLVIKFQSGFVGVTGHTCGEKFAWRWTADEFFSLICSLAQEGALAKGGLA